MRIGIDISQIVYEGTGTGTYYKNLVKWLPRIDPVNEYVFFGSSLRRKKAFLQAKAGLHPGIGARVSQKLFSFPPAILDVLWNRLHIFPVENLIGKIDVLHSSDWTCPPTKGKLVAPILDMVVYKFPKSSHPKIIATQKRRLRWVQKEADRIITISESSKKDIVEILGIPPEKISVVPLAAGEEFKPASPKEIAVIREKYHLIKDYILTVGTQEPRKNINRVIEAFTKLSPKNTELAIAGKFGWGNQNLKFKIENLKFLGFVPQEDLPALYSGAKCFLYPSLYEGFGVPVLEAMACGCPVVTSNVGSLPEVSGKAALYVNPLDVEEISLKLLKILKLLRPERENLIKQGFEQAKKFSWEKTARETLKVYEGLS